MKRIASFLINHDTLLPGVYVSRVDGDVVTYDVRMKRPNEGDYLDNAAMHTIEHLFATFARNSRFADGVVYVGPMGCRTGFYLLLRGHVTKEEALWLIREAFCFIAEFDGDLPGARREECGNYKEHSLSAAREEAANYLVVLDGIADTRMIYPD